MKGWPSLLTILLPDIENEVAGSLRLAGVVVVADGVVVVADRVVRVDEPERCFGAET